MAVAKNDVDEAMLAAKKDVEEAKDAAREEVETAMAATKLEISDAMVAAQTDVEEAKVAASDQMAAAMAATKLDVTAAMVAAKMDVEDAKDAAKIGVEEAKVAASEEIAAAMALIKRDAEAAMVAAKADVEKAKNAAKTDVEEAKVAARQKTEEAKDAARDEVVAAMAAAQIREARLAARGDNPERRLRRSVALSAGLPPGKKYHYFLSHKKEHSTLGRQPESLAMALHDAQILEGFVGFFDVDDLKTISLEQLAEDVRSSCALVVVLHDETCASSWCQCEWEAAGLAGIPCLCIVDVNHVCRTKVLEQVKACNPHLMKHQWVSYIDSYRHDASIQITDWLHEHATQG
ncbi:unnamed protein product [Polarella glacialis]|uniref:TIR domain-containing protein n=1 Tax=Polarella glacialis TaxID=89957 RepID=A0A813E2T7_POLGL|nr:unnamed protein product [Polarella glacialis]